MQIVIDVPKYIVDMCKASGCVIDADTEKVGKAIATGSPLPEHHGRLIDADALLKEHPINTYTFPSIVVENAPTIIPATKEAESEAT
jgi:hypothetical protein